MASIRWLALLGALPAAVAASCTVKGRDCTTIACDDNLSVAVDFPAPPPKDAIAVKVCRNGVCSASLPSGDGGANDPYRTCVVTGDLGDVVCYFVAQQGGRLALNLRLVAEYTKEHSVLHDGDAYEVHVTDATSGAVLVDLEESVTYEHVQPNGAECDGDFYCQEATLRTSS